MTTFVPLAADIDGTLSAIAVGDWLLQVIKTRRPEMFQTFYGKLVEMFHVNPETEEQQIGDHIGVFRLLLSQEDILFECLRDASSNGDVGILVAVPDTTGEQSKEREVRKTYVEILREVEEMFSVLMSMLALRVTDPKIAAAAADELMQILTKSKTEMPEFRLKLLQALYNVFPPSFPYRFSIFLSTLQYASDTNLFLTMVPYVQYIDEWMKDWDFDVASKRRVFLILAQQLKKLDKRNEAYRFLRRHVEGFQRETPEVLASSDTVAAAAELAVDSIRQSDILYFDSIVSLDAIQHLHVTPHKPLIELLEIFLQGGPRDFLAFYDKHTQLFEDNNLEKEASLNKIRLLALASRCVGFSELTLKELGDTIGVEDNGALEEAVVQAIGQGLLDAKIDQIKRCVQIKSAMHRVFEKDQWELLLSRLNIWTENVKTLGKSESEKHQMMIADPVTAS